MKASKKEIIETLVMIWTCSSYFKIWRPEYDGTPRSSPKTSLSEVNWKDNLLSTNNKSNTIAQHVVQHLLLEHFPARHLSHEGHGHPRAWGQFKDLHDRPAGKFFIPHVYVFIPSPHICQFWYTMVLSGPVKVHQKCAIARQNSQKRPKFCVLYAKKYTSLKKVHRC